MKRTIKMQVEESVTEEVKILQLGGIDYLRFKDLKFSSDEFLFVGVSGSSLLGWEHYEVRVAWNYLKSNFDYGFFDVPGNHKNAKFFYIKENLQSN
ncbi:hypothetical protein HNP99_001616 [Flavobacterium sp. 28A]|uniref:hypothetical protein n=1 Tax=Flavobacterium sp. 28A TaxID=2735895 RepID=UPI0015704645|nr:hypothetical protein [Flavobacterium sp. 28A]NRT15269.1 hypothetical protein [Flavobacterium sp. 28A]